MKMNVRSIAAPLMCAAVLAVSGCEDSAAKERDAVQASMAELSSDLQVALATAGGPASEETAAAQQKLTNIVARLGQLNGGEPGQQAAKSLLAATALRELADMHMAAADLSETKHRALRAVVHDQIDAILQHQALIDGLQSVDGKAERETLDRELAAAKTSVAELQARIDELKGPIDEQTGQNAAAIEERDRLRIEVGNLLRRAQELGHADGFETFKQASATARQADQVEYEISKREIELAYKLEPEHKLADMQNSQLQAMIQAIEAAQAQLEAFNQTSFQSMKTSRDQIDALVAEITKSIGAIDADAGGAMGTNYEQALESLEKAAAQAQSAAGSLRGDDAHAAHLVTARVRELQGRLHWGRARGLADHRAVLQRLVQAGEQIGSTGKFDQQLKSASAAFDQSIEQAKAAYAAATEALAQAQIRDSGDLDLFRQNLDSASAALAGKAAPVPPERTADPAEGATDGAAVDAAPTGDGFATAEELWQHLMSLPETGEGMAATAALTHASTPEGTRRVKLQSDLAAAFSQLDAAMQEQFQVSFMQALGPAAAAMTPDLSKAKVTEKADDRVVYTIQMMGQSQRTVLRKIDGAWRIDADDISAQEKLMLPMQEQLVAGMSQAATSMAQRIRAGEFKTQQEVVEAFNQAMMSGMGGMGGMGGGPPRATRGGGGAVEK